MDPTPHPLGAHSARAGMLSPTPLLSPGIRSSGAALGGAQNSRFSDFPAARALTAIRLFARIAAEASPCSAGSVQVLGDVGKVPVWTPALRVRGGGGGRSGAGEAAAAS